MSTQGPRPSAGAELISTCPPGSVVRRPPPGSAPGALSPARATATRCWSTGMPGSQSSRTSHSSSTPTLPGGPVLKQIPCTCSSALLSVSGSASGPSGRQLTAPPANPFLGEAGICGGSAGSSSSLSVVTALTPAPGPGEPAASWRLLVMSVVPSVSVDDRLVVDNLSAATDIPRCSTLGRRGDAPGEGN